MVADPARDRGGGAPVARLLLPLHLLALGCWIAAALAAALLRARARRLGETPEALRRHRAAMAPLRLEQAAFALLLVSGLLLMQSHGWGLTRARWLGAKLSLVAFLLVPLEAMHAYVAHFWIAPGLRDSAGGTAFTKTLARGLGVEEMIRTLELVLLTPAVPLLVWLSVWKPF